MYAVDGATVYAWESAIVRAADSAIVRAAGRAVVYASDSATVYASGSVFVRVFSALKITASAHVVIMLHGAAKSVKGGQQIAVYDGGRIEAASVPGGAA